MLGISSDEDSDNVEQELLDNPDGETAQLAASYEILGYLLGEAIEVASEAL